MKKLVIIPGGFHPLHQGHVALYNAAREAFPSADIYMAATADTSTRPFPFEIKKQLARAAGIPPHRFIQVKSPFRAQEITQMYDPNETQLIFVRSEKDRDQQPQAGGVKKDGTASYLQPYRRNGLEPMSKHGYMVYLPTVQFGPGMTSATEIRAKWPEMTDTQKTALVHQIYPMSQQKKDLADVVIKMFDNVLGTAANEGANGAQAGLMGAPAGSGSGILQAATVSMPNAQDRPRKAVRMGREFDEAVVVNDPDLGMRIRPAGGMGTWREEDMVRDLATKFSDMLNMLKTKNYQGLYHIMYKARMIESMVRALAEYQAFQTRQGRRPLARGSEVDTTDYLQEK